MKRAKKILCVFLTICIFASILTIGTTYVSANYGDELRRPVITDIVVSNPNGANSSLPATNRYYFYMPTDWRNVYNDSYDSKSLDSCQAGIYWYAGSYMPSDNQGDLSNAWPGYSIPNVVKADSNIFYCDVPRDSGNIIFNNLVDGGMDDTQPYYRFACQTREIKCDNYEVGDDEYGFYKTLDNMDGMIYVCNSVDTELNQYSGKTIYKGDWFYYYGDETYGPLPTKEEAEATDEVYSNGEFPYRVKLSTRFLTLYVNDPDDNKASVHVGTDTDVVASITKGAEFFSITQNFETGAVTATAKGEGEGEISFWKMDNKGNTFVAICHVSVRVLPTKINLDSLSLSIMWGETVEIKPSIENPWGKTTYSSSAPEIATVSDTGVVTGIKDGKAILTVTNNGVSKEIEVIVSSLQGVSVIEKLIKEGTELISDSDASAFAWIARVTNENEKYPTSFVYSDIKSIAQAAKNGSDISNFNYKNQLLGYLENLRDEMNNAELKTVTDLIEEGNSISNDGLPNAYKWIIDVLKTTQKYSNSSVYSAIQSEANSAKNCSSISDFNSKNKILGYLSVLKDEIGESQEIETPTQAPTQEPTAPHKTDISKWTVNGIKNMTYTGKVLKQGNILVSNDGEYADFSVKYRNNVNVGTATVTITGTGDYTGSIVRTFKIVKANNPMAVSASAKTVKYSAVKKKNVSVTALTVKKAQGAVSFKKTSGNSKITVNAKTGKITVKKGLKKGTYTVKIKVTAKGSSNYKSGAKTVSVKIKIK